MKQKPNWRKGTAVPTSAGLVDSNDVVLYLYYATGIFTSGVFAQFIDREVVAMAIEIARVVNQDDVFAHRMTIDAFHFLFDGRIDVAPVRVKPEERWFLNIGNDGRQDFAAIALIQMNPRVGGELTLCARRQPGVEFDRINLAKPIFLGVHHVAQVRSRFHHYVKVEALGELCERPLLHDVRHLRLRRTSQPPPDILAAKRKSLVRVEENAVAESLMNDLAGLVDVFSLEHAK
jgi:hypothetical protein